MTHFRPFRNGDPPALADLWNRGLPDRAVARPLNGHDFDSLVIGRLDFEAEGLIVAEQDGRAVGFVHAGFGPAEPEGPSHRLDIEMGTIAMLVVDPAAADDPGLERGLVVEAERYLRRRGAAVIYAGGQYPINPFYWGLYGGSEWAGVLSSHLSFRRAAEGLGYEPVAATALWEVDLTRGPEPRDPRGAFLRRQTRLEVNDDALLPRWWDSLALGDYHPAVFRLRDRATDRPVAHAVTWDMTHLARDGRSRAGLIALEVDPEFRRRGFGRHIVAEVLRDARARYTEVVSVQTPTTNAVALRLYESIGFVRVETTTLYRLPAGQGSRAAGEL